MLPEPNPAESGVGGANGWQYTSPIDLAVPSGNLSVDLDAWLANPMSTISAGGLSTSHLA